MLESLCWQEHQKRNALAEAPRLRLKQLMQLTQQRTVLLALSNGTYVSRRAPSDVRSAMLDAMGGDGELDCKPETASLAIDLAMLTLVLLEALSNARKYRQPGTPIRVSTALRSAESADGERLEGERVLALTVTNQNRDGMRPLDDEQCESAFAAGYRAPQTHAASSSSAPAELSAGIGLSTAAQAASAAYGRVWLSPHDEQGIGHTSLCLELPATAVPVDGSADGEGAAQQPAVSQASDAVADPAAATSSVVPRNPFLDGG
jgi:signal transduction histidine kinase